MNALERDGASEGAILHPNTLNHPILQRACGLGAAIPRALGAPILRLDGESFAHSFELFFRGAGGEDVGVGVMGGESGEDFGDLGGRFAFAEDNFGHALAKGAMVVELGEAEVFERKMTETLNSLVGRELFGPDFMEQLSEGVRVHGEGTL